MARRSILSTTAFKVLSRRPMDDTTVDSHVRAVTASITYVAPGSRINRRFVAPGVEYNTGRYEAHSVSVRDGRSIKEQFNLDVHGFVLARWPTAIRDFFDKEEVDRAYPDEVLAAVKSLTGVTRVAPMGWMVRTSGDVAGHQKQTVGYTHRGGVQPPAVCDARSVGRRRRTQHHVHRRPRSVRSAAGAGMMEA